MKKVISIVLSVIMLISVMGICVNAEDANSYIGSANIKIDATNTFNPETFDMSLSLNSDKLGVLDGESADFTYTIDNVRTLSGKNYYDDPEGFFADFTAEGFSGTTITVDFTVNFLSDAIFGELGYIITIKGFSAPLDLGIDLGGLGGLLGGGEDTEIDLSANIPTDIVQTGALEGVPTIDSSSIKILGRPEKSDYYDSEKFDPTGTKLEFSLSNGKTGTFTYNEENAKIFTFNPTTKEQLSCYDSEVATFISGIYVMSTPITVQHKWSAGYASITTDKYTENKPGYHAIVCEGCGETHDAQPHTPKNSQWTYNNDETFVANGTESNECADCGTVLIRDTFGTAGFNTTFADMHFFLVIFEYINVLLRFITAAIG